LPVARVLLIPQALIHRNDGVELVFGGIEQWPVIEIRPPTLVRRLGTMPRQQGGKGPW